MKKILGIGLCFVVCWSASAKEIPSINDDGVVDTIYGLEALFVEQQYQFLPISPPSEDVYIHSHKTVVPVDWKRFPNAFSKQMYAEMDANGYPIYRVTVYEDPITREAVFLNSYGTEVYRLVAEKDYDPYAWQKIHFKLESGQVLDDWSRWLYDPAKISASFVLLPEVFHSNFLVMQEEEAALKAAAVSVAMVSPPESDGVSIRMAGVPATTTLTENEESLMDMAMASSLPSPPGGGTNSPPAGSDGGSSNLVMELAITMPLDCGPYVEIFQKQNLIYPQLWNVAVNKMAVTGGVETIWADPASSNATTMFYIVGDTSAGIDDGDGYSELRERYVTGTDPTVFDFIDTDSDGLHDWFEIMCFGDIVSQSGNDDFDGDGLANDQEMILHSNSVEMICDASLFDTDGDGTDDGTEVAQGGNPSDPSDNGLPPDPPATNATAQVTLLVKSYGLGSSFTLSMANGTNTYSWTSDETQTTSNTFFVVKGHSYLLSLTQEGEAQCGGEMGYVASVSGDDIFVVDPDEILGNHLGDPALQGTSTGTVHVVKIETETVATAPTDRTRKTIGVGEAVDLTFLPSGLSPISWSASGAGGLSATTGSSVTFTASDVATNSTITATYDEHGFSTTLTMIEPTGIKMHKISELSYPTNSAAAGMVCSIEILPNTVSFYNIEVREQDGPASDVSGYFTIFTAQELAHDASDVWVSFEFNNLSGDSDTAFSSPLPQPWQDGSFVWHIPYYYRVVIDSGNGQEFATIDQEFEIWQNGTVEVRKAGTSVTRSP